MNFIICAALKLAFANALNLNLSKPLLFGHLPWTCVDFFPALYWVTLCNVCFLHCLPLQNVFLDLGILTCKDVGLLNGKQMERGTIFPALY